MSVFSEIMAQLVKYSIIVDNGTCNKENYNDFLELQNRIHKAYTDGRYNETSFNALWAISNHIKQDFLYLMNCGKYYHCEENNTERNYNNV